MSNWKLACPLAKIPDDEPLGVKLGERRVALYKVDGEVFATNDVCTHAFALLSTGFLEGHRVECPLHGAVFDIRSGHCDGAMYDDIETFATDVRDGEVYIDVAD